MNKQIFNFLWGITKPYKWWMLLMMVAPITSNAFALAFNYSVKLIIDTTTAHDYITFNMYLYPLLCLIAGLAIVEIFWSIHAIGEFKVHPLIYRDLITKVFTHILKHDYSYFQNIHSGSLLAKIKGVEQGWWNIWTSIGYKMTEPLARTIIFSIALIFISSKLFFIVLIFFIVVSPISYYLYNVSSNLKEKDSNSYYGIMGFISDKITNIFSIFSFAKKNYEIRRLDNIFAEKAVPASKAYHKQNIFNHILLIFPYWSMILSMFVTTIILYNNKEISLGDIAFTMMNAFNLMDSVFRLNMEISEIIKNLGDIRATFSIILDPVAQQDKKNAGPILINKGEIIFNKISNYYDGKKILKDLSIHIKSGQRIGLVGYSGSGKSTLINLLVRYIQPTSGEVLIDGQNIADVQQDSLRSQISIIPQDCTLFHTTIAENIGYAKEDTTMAEIVEAAKLANIHHFIETLPEKYNTQVGERGVKLSGGQRQRIAISRAVLKKAPILILDEATSSLDSITEEEIQKSINEMLDKTKSTVIAIAHRLSTIKHLDRIIVLDNGSVVEDDTFTNLLAKPNGKFKAMWDSQTNGMFF